MRYLFCTRGVIGYYIIIHVLQLGGDAACDWYHVVQQLSQCTILLAFTGDRIEEGLSAFDLIFYFYFYIVFLIIEVTLSHSS